MTTLMHAAVGSISTWVSQKGGTIDSVVSGIHRQEKKTNTNSSSNSTSFEEHISETASLSSYTCENETNDDCNHQEYDSLLYLPEQPQPEENHIIDGNTTTGSTVPSWNTIQSKLTNTITNIFLESQHNMNPVGTSMIPPTRHTCTNNGDMVNDTAYHDTNYDDDDDSDNEDAIHVLYYHQYLVPDDDDDATPENRTHPPNTKTLTKNRRNINNHHVTESRTMVHDNIAPNRSIHESIEAMMDQLDLHTILYSTHHIYDVRIYESILILLLFSNTNNHNNDDTTATVSEYEEAIQIMATFLVDPSISFPSKLDVLQLLLVQYCRAEYQSSLDTTSSNNNNNNVSVLFRAPADEIIRIPDEIVRDMYAFCISLYFGVNDMEYTIRRCGGASYGDHDDSRTDDGTFGASILVNSITATESTSSCTSSQRLLCPMIWELRSKCLYLQEMYTIYDDISMIRRRTRVTTTATTQWSSAERQLRDEDPGWEYIKHYCLDHDSILLQDLDLLKSFYNIVGRGRNHSQSLQYIMLIASVGHLRICMYHPAVGVTCQNYYKYSEALHNVALFLSHRRVSNQWKMAVLYCLQYNNHDNSAVASYYTFQPKQSQDGDFLYYAKVLSFCTCKNAYTDSFLVTTTSSTSSSPPRHDATTAISATITSTDPNDATVQTNHTSSSSLCAFYLLLWELRVVTCQLQQQRQHRMDWICIVRHRLEQIRTFVSNRTSQIRSRPNHTRPNHIIRTTKQMMTHPVFPVVIQRTTTKLHQVREQLRLLLLLQRTSKA